MIFDSKKKFDGVHKNGIIGLSIGMIDLTKCVAHNSGLRQFGIEILVTDESSLYLAANSLAEQKVGSRTGVNLRLRRRFNQDNECEEKLYSKPQSKKALRAFEQCSAFAILFPNECTS